MDSILSTFLLFIAAIVALLTYLILPRVPVVTLIAMASIALAAGVWWHWTQFAVDYRTSTWQEQLRLYASYALLLLVILLSYLFYVFGWKNSSLSELASRTSSVVRDTTRQVTQKIITGTSRSLSTANDLLLKSSSEPSVIGGILGNTNRSASGRTGANILT